MTRDEYLAAKFWLRVDNTDSADECWTWTGYTEAKSGYGRLSFGGARSYAHRVAYELAVGPIPEGLDLDHLCRVRNCVNPTHLEPVTRGENVRRAHRARHETPAPSPEATGGPAIPTG